MKQYPFFSGRIGRCLFALLLFVVLFLARDTLVTTSILGLNRAQFLLLGIVCVVGIVFLVKHRRQWKDILLDKRMLFLAVATAVFLVPMVLKRDWQLMYFSILLCIYVAVFFSYFISYRDAAKCYVLIMTVLGAYSVLATYVLRILPDRGILPVPVFYNANEVMFHNFGVAFVSDEFVKNRNFGIFREPGVYQYFLILALVLNNYTVTWEKQRHLWLVNVLLSVTMVSTFATGGVAELGLLVLVVFFDKKLYRDKRAVIIASVLVVAAAVLVVISIIQRNALYWALWDMIVWKLMKGSDSASDRTLSILINLQMFLRSPLVGDKISTVLHALTNNTSSSTILLAISGIFGGVLHVVSWVALLWEKNRKVWVNLSLLVIMLLAFNTQNLIADMFLWLFPVMALAERGIPWLENRKKKV